MAQVTDLGFTVNDLIAAQGVGDVRMQKHPDFPNLTIWNYTEEVQFRNRWNKVTLACRGLIIDLETEEVVARPWEKFFNLGQMDNRIDSLAPVEVTDKMDGSLGILYQRPDGEYAIATRGSFASEQAIHATETLHKNYQYALDMAGFTLYNTYLFEIIYPDNRIVVNYGDMDDLVLLGAVNKERGYYYGPVEAEAMLGWNGPRAQIWYYNHFVDAISHPERKGKEGVVIRSGRNIVKLKQADYVELHRIVTNLSPKTVWEMLGDGKTVDDICGNIPDEFHTYVQDIADKLLFDASEIKFKVRLSFDKIMHDLFLNDTSVTRKQFATLATKTDYAKYLFLMFDDKSIDEAVWNSIKPRGDVKSLVEDEG